MPRTTARSARSARCTCNPGFMILAVILFTLGIYSIAAGFIAQFNYAAAGPVLVWYLIGVVLIAIAKMAKWKSFTSCPAHTM